MANQEKKVFFIRHAESINNVAKREAKEMWSNMRRFRSLPTWNQVCCTASLVTIPMNTDLSPDGVRMVETLRKKLFESSFVEIGGVDLIIHSHLQRARRTCRILFEEFSSIPIEENPLIFEKNISEHLHMRDIKIRVESFRDYLLSSSARSIVVVGHSAFLRNLLAIDAIDNCEVLCCNLSSEGAFENLHQWCEGGASLISNQAVDSNEIETVSEKR